MNYEITVNELTNGGSIKGFASVVFEGSFKVGCIAIMENGSTGELFVSMPHYASKKEEGEYKDICNPITKDFRRELYENILEAFENLLQDGTKHLKVGEPEKGKLDFAVRVTPFEREGSTLKGFGSIVIGECFAVSNISILEGKKGLFVSMPSQKTKNKTEEGKVKYMDICYPVTKECRDAVYGAVMEQYQKEVTKQQTAGNTGKEGLEEDRKRDERNSR